MSEIAIVGGGPSGAMCGEQLALAGNTVHIYDEHLAWEKPCGGGLTYKATQRFPFLLQNDHPKKLIRDVEIISAENQRVKLDLQHPIVIYSRTVLNGMLLPFVLGLVLGGLRATRELRPRRGDASDADMLARLEPAQVTRLKQVAYQFHSELAFTYPEIANKLNLSDTQKKQIKAIEDESNEAKRAIRSSLEVDREGTMKKMAEHRKKTVARIVAKLNPEQQKTWKEMIGAPFDFKEDFPPSAN